jgi:hypothetical protein
MTVRPDSARSNQENQPIGKFCLRDLDATSVGMKVFFKENPHPVPGLYTHKGEGTPSSRFTLQIADV